MTKKKNPRDLKRRPRTCPPCKPAPHWNRNRQEYLECTVCGAFIKYTGKVRR